MRTACVTGWPVAHSRSPAIHRFWLARHGIEGDYVAYLVAPETADAFYRNFEASGFVGANVTLPHKEIAAHVAAHKTPAAERLGAANTLWLDQAQLVADNTDGIGFLASLDQRAPGWAERTECALILGAGGATRAVLDALLSRGVPRIDLLNRTEARAHELAAFFGDGRVTPGSLQGLAAALSRADLVVNATSAGLHGAPGLDLPWDTAKPDALATDLVYVPLKTPFLAGAEAAGLATVDGLGMLLHQAVPGFERWFGVRPQVDEELRRHILADLARAA
ncbi:shikimate dehydrogenase [Afifella sp. IM 167]|uniref:shikimate dehydrogenase n=1 Tax=Afifella sp. IM 167 TaxID=2033586 RepID=UPI001CC9DD65|nr:shikimate dehydrogenase [Afifella sp. IM 167]MBZ8133531.1 shikimate dehydrogenase [Afifella sp. IM 167]